MRALLILLCLMLPLFSFYAGEVLVEVDKTWEISSEETVTDLALNGTFLLENEYQSILEMNVSPGAAFQNVNGTTYVIFEQAEFRGKKIIVARALVSAKYPLAISSNPAFVPSKVNSTPLTQADNGIASIAHSISSDSKTQLEAVTKLTDWTHRYIEYDLRYWGDPAPASEVFANPKAVCVGYSHLLISMLNSLGFETRFVSGYAFADEWQSHAWLEAKIGESWIPIDPTFREVGALDARHIASSYSQDQSQVFDSLIARGKGFDFNSTVSVKTLEKEPFEEVLFIHTVLYDDEFKVIIYNPTKAYVTPTYELSLPEYLLAKDTQILTISPKEFATLNYQLSTGDLEPGYAHQIPYLITLQGTTITDEHTLVKGTLQNGEPTEQYELPKDETQSCPLLLFSLVSTATLVFVKHLQFQE